MQSASAPGNATCTANPTTTYEGVTYTYDSANASNVLSTPLIDGQTVVLHRYWKRTAEYAYKIVDHFTLTINGVAQTPETADGTVQTTSVPGNATCIAAGSTTHNSVT